MFVSFHAEAFTDAQTLALRKLFNKLASHPMIVEHCELHFGLTFFRADISASDPVALWDAIQKEIYNDPTHGHWIRELPSTAFWQGEDWFLDGLWVYRSDRDSSDQLDGLANRMQCKECERFFWVGHANRPWNCPYCERPLDSEMPDDLDLA
jgi:hypothetical protein